MAVTQSRDATETRTEKGIKPRPRARSDRRNSPPGSPNHPTQHIPDPATSLASLASLARRVGKERVGKEERVTSRKRAAENVPRTRGGGTNHPAMGRRTTARALCVWSC
jgi:hypothetical protein